jgi:Kef-type K+ transport system membrane component KefB
MPDILESISAAVLRHGFHPFYLYAFVVWLALLALRSLHWRRRRYVRCETCGHAGYAHNEVPGSWRHEIIRFVLFVPPGFFFYLLMGLYLSYFITRWFVIRSCARCGSERLERIAAPERVRLPWRPLAGVTVLTGAGLAVFFFIRAQGEQLPISQAAAEAAARFQAPPGDALWRVLLSLAAIIVVARAVGAVFKRLGQPAVIGEIVAGIALGPSLFGLASPAAHDLLLPQNVAPFLGIIANIGVVLFMFLVGVELDTRQLRGRTGEALTIAHASMVVPFVFGSALAYFLYGEFAPAGTSFTVFALFVGAALSVTAFPVLARILTDHGLHRTPLGTTALTCASMNDLAAWLLLALASSVAVARPGVGLFTTLLAGAYVGVMLAFVRPWLRRWAGKYDDESRPVTHDALAVIFVALLLSALATEAIGIHALFGAFLLGAFIPHDSRLARALETRLLDTVVVLFLPAFFAYTGMRTQIGLLSGGADWLVCGVVFAVATAGKFGGTLLASRATGMPWRDAAALGVLMNTRGLMELIVLNVGVDLGVISLRLFTMLVLMAVATTFMTSPLILALRRRGAFALARAVPGRA